MVIKKVFTKPETKQRIQAYDLSDLLKFYNDWKTLKAVPDKLEMVQLGVKSTLSLKECKTGRDIENFARLYYRYIYGGYKTLPVEEMLLQDEPQPEEIFRAVAERYLELKGHKTAPNVTVKASAPNNTPK